MMTIYKDDHWCIVISQSQYYQDVFLNPIKGRNNGLLEVSAYGRDQNSSEEPSTPDINTSTHIVYIFYNIFNLY